MKERAQETIGQLVYYQHYRKYSKNYYIDKQIAILISIFLKKQVDLGKALVPLLNCNDRVNV